ncbi:hypothetical protein ACHAXA_002172 [Cyclostephanos tholiformis]|uniref:RNB domain-containing protein n=1 Tax=Cyclostephanos tholiformis TaxID=382380 RepID=A0ABD3RVH8_9STRA
MAASRSIGRITRPDNENRKEREDDNNGRKEGEGDKDKSKTREKMRKEERSRNNGRCRPRRPMRSNKDEVRREIGDNTCNGRDDNDKEGKKTTLKEEKGGEGVERKSRTKSVMYQAHVSLHTCSSRYGSCDPILIRGKLRVVPNGMSFVTCDRGSSGVGGRDVIVKNEKDRNRALDGDMVYVELYPAEVVDDVDGGGGSPGGCRGGTTEAKASLVDYMSDLELGECPGSGNVMEKEEADCSLSMKKEVEKTQEDGEGEEGVDDGFEYEVEECITEDWEQRGVIRRRDEGTEDEETWQNDEVQRSLWNPTVNLRRKCRDSNIVVFHRSSSSNTTHQRSGRVICILPPKSVILGNRRRLPPSELMPEGGQHNRERDRQHNDDVEGHDAPPTRTIVGSLVRLPGPRGDRGGDNGNKWSSGRYLLVPNIKSLPRFMCPPRTMGGTTETGVNTSTLYQAEYVHGSWHATMRWPPCRGVTRLCGSCTVRDETRALLVENGVDHGDFPQEALRDVDTSVESGRYIDACKGDDDHGWRPTEEMLCGRRDYRRHRVFTIDPTTARDLDDALHITPMPDGWVEIGVHIADVSHFLRPGTAVDEEALRRATTVYLVNDVIPMLPRPLCEVACSLNENVERLAFSCVWRMRLDGTLAGGGSGSMTGKSDVWYGKTVIKSCARLDYATAQNIIDGKVGIGEVRPDEALWPKSRQPTGGHTTNEVASDVRLMHKVAMARRRLRFENGALALNGIKLAFQLEEDGETPALCRPYPIRDSNRLIEEYMLLANYLVAQRLITHTRGRALLRHHPPPLEGGMQQVVDASREAFDFDIDITNSMTLQESLSRLSRECDDELVVQCVTESLMNPMRPAQYMAAGEVDEADWQHFALNIPYYTHFTSPIRRYPDVIVHRLLQATLDDTVDNFPMTQQEIHAVAGHCNDMRMAAKKAQERSDRIFLSLYVKRNPISSTLGVCLGVGEKTFTVFVPSLGMSTRVFLQEHENEFNSNAFEDSSGKRRIVIQPQNAITDPSASGDRSQSCSWESLEIGVFTKLEVACTCKLQPPIDVRVKVIGPWITG